MDPDFIGELMIHKTARADAELLSIDQPSDAIRRRQASRKAAIVRWRDQVRREATADSK